MAERGYQFGPVLTDRIISVVRRVDGEPHRTGVTRVQTRFEGDQALPSRNFRICTFTGAWAINSSKAVTFYGVTSTPNTITAQNLLFPLPSLSTNTASPTICAIGKDGTAWHVINVMHASHDVLTGASLGPSDLQFTRRSALSISVTATTVGISASSCDQKASAAQLSSFLG